MRFLVFNLTVLAALAYLFAGTGQLGGVDRLAQRTMEATQRALAYAQTVVAGETDAPAPAVGASDPARQAEADPADATPQVAVGGGGGAAAPAPTAARNGGSGRQPDQPRTAASTKPAPEADPPAPNEPPTVVKSGETPDPQPAQKAAAEPTAAETTAAETTAPPAAGSRADSGTGAKPQSRTRPDAGSTAAGPTQATEQSDRAPRSPADRAPASEPDAGSGPEIAAAQAPAAASERADRPAPKAGAQVIGNASRSGSNQPVMLSEDTPLMSAAERRRALRQLSREMELLFVDSLQE